MSTSVLRFQANGRVLLVSPLSLCNHYRHASSGKLVCHWRHCRSVCVIFSSATESHKAALIDFLCQRLFARKRNWFFLVSTPNIHEKDRPQRTRTRPEVRSNLPTSSNTNQNREYPADSRTRLWMIHDRSAVCFGSHGRKGRVETIMLSFLSSATTWNS